MSETVITIHGHVAHNPEIRVTQNKTEMVVFRVGVNPRRYDRQRDEWVDGQTEWYSVLSFGNLGQNVSKSIRKGDPVIVHGRFRAPQWQPEDQKRPITTLEIMAHSVGHDLRLGRSTHLRVRYDENGHELDPTARDAQKTGDDLGDDAAAQAPEYDDAAYESGESEVAEGEFATV